MGRPMIDGRLRYDDVMKGIAGAEHGIPLNLTAKEREREEYGTSNTQHSAAQH